MISSSYDGLIQMEPNLENREFFTGDDDFTYQVPRVYFECLGESTDTQTMLEWDDASVITFKDNRALKYTESTYYEYLLPNENGEESWYIGKYEFLGEDELKYARDIRPVKSYTIEEFDWNKSEKRRYKVILEETSKLEKYDEAYLKRVIDRDSHGEGREYILKQP
jgi:hypothetical protein